jgi:predicted enzyme related to lactoylglutathione lyase
MSQAISLIAYPVTDMDAATKLYSTFLGIEPYVKSGYYTGFHVSDHEVGLVRGQQGIIAYVDVTDIKASLQALLDAGAQLNQDVTDVANGLLIATVKDADGNIIGLRQQS